MLEGTDPLPVDRAWAKADEAAAANLSVALARPHFRSHADGYDREDVDAFVLSAESAQLQLQKRINQLETAIREYEQGANRAEAHYRAQLANHAHDVAVVRGTRQHLEQWLSSSIPVLCQYQALLRDVDFAQPTASRRR